MICSHCHYNYPEHAQYCAQCGNKTLYNPTLGAVNKNVVAVWLFVGVSLFSQLVWRLISLVVVPRLISTHNLAKIPDIYEVWGTVAMLLELAVCIAVIAIIRNTPARIAVGLYTFFHVILYIVTKVAAHQMS